MSYICVANSGGGSSGWMLPMLWNLGVVCWMKIKEYMARCNYSFTKYYRVSWNQY
jgi:hypothetical protein